MFLKLPGFWHHVQVWTYAARVAFVLSVTAKGEPIRDDVKLQRLRQMLLNIMSSDGRGTVISRKVGRLSHSAHRTWPPRTPTCTVRNCTASINLLHLQMHRDGKPALPSIHGDATASGFMCFEGQRGCRVSSAGSYLLCAQ